MTRPGRRKNSSYLWKEYSLSTSTDLDFCKYFKFRIMSSITAVTLICRYRLWSRKFVPPTERRLFYKNECRGAVEAQVSSVKGCRYIAYMIVDCPHSLSVASHFPSQVITCFLSLVISSIVYGRPLQAIEAISPPLLI